MKWLIMSQVSQKCNVFGCITSDRCNHLLAVVCLRNVVIELIFYFIPAAPSGDGGGETSGGQQGGGRRSGRDGEEVQAGEGEVQRRAGGGGEEAGGPTQTANLPNQEEAVGEFSSRQPQVGFLKNTFAVSG